MGKKILFDIKFEEHLGTIYIHPIMHVKGSFDGETDLEEFITQITKDIRERVGKYINKKEVHIGG